MLSDFLKQCYSLESVILEHYAREHPAYKEILESEDCLAGMRDFKYNITRITMVQNHYLYGCFQLKKAEYESRGSPATVMQLYHDTDASNVPSILSTNFDYRLVQNSRYGRGIYFTTHPEHGYKYSSGRSCSKALIVADVLIGIRQRIYEPDYECILPIQPCDTTVACYEKVYVKYYDNEFYPRYVVYYDQEDNTDSE